MASGVNINASTAHTLQYGDGSSTAVGASTSGFVFEGFVGSGRLNFGTVTVNAGAAATRVVTQASFTNAINGALTVTSGTFNQNALTTNIGGNISVATAGIFIASGTTIFTNTTGTTTTAQTTVQSVSVAGSGSIQNLTSSPTGNFNNATINNQSTTGVTFNTLNNLSGAAGFTGASVTGALIFNGFATTTGSNALLVGSASTNPGSPATFTAGGMLSGSTFARGWNAAQAGTAITASADPVGTNNRFRFIDAPNIVTGQIRDAFIERNTTLATGITGVRYTNGSGTSAVSITDGAYTVDTRSNGVWDVTVFGTSPFATADFAISATNAFGGSPTGTGVRITSLNGIVGTYQAGTVFPTGQRVLALSEITAQSFYLGINSSEVPFISIANGSWETASTWNKNAVPTSTDAVTIGTGTSVTVNSTASTAAAVTVNSGGALTVSGSTLGIASLTNSGTLNVNGGTMTASTTIANNAGSTITVSGSGTLAATTTLSNSGTINANGGTVNVTAAATTGITNNSGGILSVNGGIINLGITNNTFCNRTFTNSSGGTLTVISGTLNVFGNLNIASGSTFNQSGGNINVDGNASGVAANSVATGTYLVAITNTVPAAINLTGGTLTVVDPHAGTSTSDYALWFSAGTAVNASAAHTLSFGNGASTDPGGHTNGFYMYLFPRFELWSTRQCICK